MASAAPATVLVDKLRIPEPMRWCSRRRARVWDGGPVNNLGQVLHRCPALGGEEVVPAADASAHGPLIVGEHFICRPPTAMMCLGMA